MEFGHDFFTRILLALGESIIVIFAISLALYFVSSEFLRSLTIRTANLSIRTALETCFLIDDDEDDREIFQLALEQVDSNFRCVTADNCMEALEILRNGSLKPDYIFLDLNMPVLTGRDCLVEIRKMAMFQKTPLIIYTTSSIPADREEVLRLGATSFVTKPNKVSTLVTLLKEVFTLT